MTVRQRKDRGGRWYYEFELDGRRHAGACLDPQTGQPAANRTEARRIEDRLRGVLLAGKEAAKAAAPAAYTLAMAAAAYAARKRGAGNWENNRTYLAELLAWFGAGTPVEWIREQAVPDLQGSRGVWDYIAWARQQPVMVYVGGGRKREDVAKLRQDGAASLYRPAADGRQRADSTINRYLVCLREVLAIAAKGRDGTGRPLLADPPEIPDLDEPEHLPRPIPDDELLEIIIVAPDHLAEAALLTRLMGFRKGEAFALEIGDVDFTHRGVWLSDPEATKGKRAEFIPAGTDALALLDELVAQARERMMRRLITWKYGRKGEWRPVANPKRAWKTALKRLGLEGRYRFHDLKASFVTAVDRAGASRQTTQKLARHKDYRTTERYLLVNDVLARQAVDGIGLKVGVASASKAIAPSQPAPSPNRQSQPQKEKAGTWPANPLEELVGAAGFEPTTPSPPD